MQLRINWMKNTCKRACAATLALGLTIAAPMAFAQQGLFAPAIIVNDKIITGYEIDQRAKMLALLNAPGDPQKEAVEQLIDDRLRIEAAEFAGLSPQDQDVQNGMVEFASRANLSREEFIQALASRGVSEETFRDFVRSGVAWRELVQLKFQGRARPSETEIDRAIESTENSGGVRVLLSEIIMPAPPNAAQSVRERANRISQLTSEAAFSAEARKYSATASRRAGGRLPWQDLSSLPPVLRNLVLGLAPGQVSDPLPIPNAIALFQLRGIEEVDYTAPEFTAIEYAMYYMPGGRSPETLAQARVLSQKIDRCDDLYGTALGQPEEVLERVTKPTADIPTDIAIELSKLDPGEVSTALTRSNGATLVFLMMCGRTSAINETVDREQLTLGLANRRLTSFADGYLAELRADAYIVRK